MLLTFSEFLEEFYKQVDIEYKYHPLKETIKKDLSTVNRTTLFKNNTDILYTAVDCGIIINYVLSGYWYIINLKARKRGAGNTLEEAILNQK